MRHTQPGAQNLPAQRRCGGFCRGLSFPQCHGRENGPIRVPRAETLSNQEARPRCYRVPSLPSCHSASSGRAGWIWAASGFNRPGWVWEGRLWTEWPSVVGRASGSPRAGLGPPTLRGRWAFRWHLSGCGPCRPRDAAGSRVWGPCGCCGAQEKGLAYGGKSCPGDPWPTVGALVASDPPYSPSGPYFPPGFAALHGVRLP